MSVFKDRKIAVLIAVVVIVLATLLGVRGSLSRLSRDIELMFYDGVYMERDGYTQPSIDSQLKRHADATLGLATVLMGYQELEDSAEEVIRLRRVLLEADAIGDKSFAFWNMSRYVYSLTQAAADVALSERDLEAVSSYSATITGAEGFIRDAAYNQESNRLWNEQSFIARIISMLIPIKQPGMF